MRAFALPIAALLLATPALAGEPLPRLAKGTPYATARTQLVQSGWTPEHLATAEPCTDEDRCGGMPEVVSCADTGNGNCLFTWKKGNTLIGVGTIYDKPPVVAGIACRSGC